MHGVYRYQFGEPEAGTPSAIFDYKLDETRCVGLPPADAPFGPEQIAYRKTARGCVLEIPMGEGESLFGLGLQLKSFNQNWKKKVMRVNSDPVADTGDSHAPVPMYVSTAGYAVLIDTARYASFYTGTHVKEDQENRQEDKGPADNTDELYAARQIAGQRRVLVDVPAAGGVTVFVFAGPSMREAIMRYNLFSGGGYLPPMWGLGVWYRACMEADQAMAERQCREIREDGIPCDVFGLEPKWQTHSYSCTYAFNRALFPDPEGLAESMKKQNFHLNLWEHGFIHPDSPIHGDMKPHSGDYQVWGGLVPDFTRDEARACFSGYHRKELIDIGVSGFKLDECDNSDFIQSPWSFPEASQFPSGLDGEQMHSLFGGLYQRTIMDAFATTGRRTFGSVRSSGPFMSDMPFVLYSDLYDHKDFIRATMNQGFAGLSWGPEVRQCQSEEELYRRIQSVIFSPMAMINAWMIPNPPWKQYDETLNKQNVLLDNAAEVTAEVRRLFQLRTRFIPYLYAAYRDYETTGLPPFRAPVMDTPDDINTHGCDLQYLMGDSLLVAPLTEGETARPVYLPAGGWYDFNTGERLEGGRWIEAQADIHTIPLFVREGALLPLAEPFCFVTPDQPMEITLYKYGTGTASCRLFEDDGETTAYRQGECNTVTVTWNGGAPAPEIVREGHYAGERYRFAGHQIIT